jgi:hypothetical protein
MYDIVIIKIARRETIHTYLFTSMVVVHGSTACHGSVRKNNNIIIIIIPLCIGDKFGTNEPTLGVSRLDKTDMCRAIAYFCRFAIRG